MVDDILKYVFFVLVCVPMLVIGGILFAKLKRVDFDIKQEAIDKKAQIERDQAEKERAAQEFKRASEAIDQRRREEHSIF